MRILLVRPPVPRHTIGLKHIMICEPLELEYVAAGLEGHEVRIMDLILEKGLKSRLRSFRPDVVGTSCYITGVNEVKRLCRSVKAWNPACRTVAGGVHSARAPEDFSDPSIDVIVRGDGTTIMPKVVASLAGGAPLLEIPGIAIPRPNGDVECTPFDSYMPDPDTLPLPRRDLVAHLRQRYYYLFHQPVATVKTTWGCWYDCNFCFTWQITDGRAFSRSPESIVNELEGIEAEEIYIVDDIFLINPKRLSEIAALLRKRNIRKKYLVYGRADFIAEHEEIIREWAELGLRAVLVGLEAATDPELDSMNKHCSVDHNRKAIEVLRRFGVDTYGSLIPQPDYLPADWERLWRFIEETGLYYVNLSPLTPLPGTALWPAYESKVVVHRRAHALWDLSHCVLPTRMPLKEYYRALLRLYCRTVLNPRRAARLTLSTRPRVFSAKYLRLWLGAFRIMFQFLTVHRHHAPAELRCAMSAGPLPAHLQKESRPCQDQPLLTATTEK